MCVCVCYTHVIGLVDVLENASLVGAGLAIRAGLDDAADDGAQLLMLLAERH